MFYILREVGAKRKMSISKYMFTLWHVCTKAIRPRLLRILEFSLVERVMVPHFRFTRGQLWTIAYNIFNGCKIYMESHMASMDNVGWDCRGIFRDSS